MKRFWAKVRKSERCWEWTAYRQRRSDGTPSYGLFCIGHTRSFLAHHVAWISVHGTVPRHLVIRHKCDNTACVRIDHMLLGTQAQNLEDMRMRGRDFKDFGKRGVDHHGAKMTPDKVREIVRLRAQGTSLAKIGVVVGLDSSTVHDICNGRTWSEVTGIARVERKPAHRILVSRDGQTKTLRAWCIALGVDYKAVHHQVSKYGGSPGVVLEAFASRDAVVPHHA